MTDQRDDGRRADTMPPTGIHHAIPGFTGQPPQTIPGAPPEAMLMIEEERQARAEMMGLLKQAATDSKQGREDIKRVLANQDMQKAALERFRDENRIRMFSYEQELVEARAEVRALRDEVSTLQGKLADVEGQVTLNSEALESLQDDEK